jgi:hypothetical protein
MGAILAPPFNPFWLEGNGSPRTSANPLPTPIVVTPLFPRAANSVLYAVMGTAMLVAAGAIAAPMIYVRSPYGDGRSNPIVQPLKFDHRHHVRDDGIDCFYCHGDAKRSPHAGVPSTETCMGCHGNIWTKSRELTLLREAHAREQPIAWARVNALPRHVYFPHDVHVKKGVGCVSCHGRVDLMGQVWQAMPLTMDWCLDCHRDPAPRLRPLSEITNMEWAPPGGADAARTFGQKIQRELDVHPPVECSECHR